MATITTPSASLPPNVHVSTHPCLLAKLSQFRSKTASARESNALVHEISLLVGYEALAASLKAVQSGTGESPLGHPYPTHAIQPAHISLVPILRSGLGMVSAITSLLPDSVPIHHLGLFREPSSLQPVEYYNNLPYHSPPLPDTAELDEHVAILLDPIIATGGTAVAAIQTLREWGVSRIVVVSVLGSAEGLVRAAGEWECVSVWVGGVDGGLDQRGMIVPGVGDVGDRLFGTKGK